MLLPGAEGSLPGERTGTLAEPRLKIAVFIDFDNIEIGVKTTLGSHFDAGAVLEAIKERGEVVTKIAYGDWTRAGDYSRSLTQHAIHMVQRNLTPGGDKNGADINLALDALEMAFTHSHINTFVIVGGDSDFMALVEKLKQYDRKVLVVGGRAFTSHILQKNCHEFIAYENLIGRRAGARGRPQQDAPLTGAVTLVRRALKVLADREVSPQLGVLKSTLLQLDPTFSEREYGASTFRDLVQRLGRAGYVTLKGTDRNIYVELREGSDGQPSLPSARESDGVPETGDAGTAADAEGPEPVAQAAPPAPPAPAREAEPPAEPAATPGAQADGYRVIHDVFQRPGLVSRWPLYLRQVKQLLRSIDETFDERRYGFSGLVEALRYCQREGLFRLDRDRQGVLRVYPGPVLQKAAALQRTEDEVTAETARQASMLDSAPPPDAVAGQRPAGAGRDAPPAFPEADEAQETPTAVDGEPAGDAARDAREDETGPEPARMPRRRSATKKASPPRKASPRPRAAKPAAPLTRRASKKTGDATPKKAGDQ